MELNFNTIILARDARSHYDAYEILQKKTSELRKTLSNRIQEHQKQFSGAGMPRGVTEHEMDLTTPALVCLAFSVELHIKLLLHSHDIPARGHEIEKLLKKLPKVDIDFISTHPYFHPTQQGQNFFDNIVMASNLFIRTRYYFEKVDTLHFNTGFCVTLTKIIRRRIVERVPYLAYDLGSVSD